MHVTDIILSFDWRFGLKNATNPLLWIVTVSYFMASFASYRARKSVEKYETHPKILERASRFWRTVTILLIVFGISEFLDMQLFLTHVARQISKACGWYHERHPFQKSIIWITVFLALTAFVLIMILFRKVLMQKILGLFGIAFLCCFVAVRAVSYHDVDAFLNTHFIGLPVGIFCELCAICCISISAVTCTLFWHFRHRHTTSSPLASVS